MSTLFTLRDRAQLRHDVRKSRFLAQAAPIADADSALDVIARLRTRDATHNCWAYRIGAQYRFNDDGEPGGSAGQPILAAIDGQAMDRVAVVVSRWFGGIKLGVGGLVRAYGGCAAGCLRSAEKHPIVERIRARIRCDFVAASLLHSRLREFDAIKHAERAAAEGIELELDVSLTRIDALAAFVRDCSRGRGVVEVT
jgi:uncharacterized YigZ family protein